jgi:hypothetical protein
MADDCQAHNFKRIPQAPIKGIAFTAAPQWCMHEFQNCPHSVRRGALKFDQGQ